MNNFKKYLLTTGVIILGACGGGGGSQVPAPIAPPPGGTMPPPTATDPVEDALKTGDASKVENSDDYLQAILNTIEDGRTLFNADMQALLKLDSDGQVTPDSPTNLSWDPTHDASWIEADFPATTPILKTNAARPGYNLSERTIGVIGKTDTARFMVFGGNPFRNTDTLSADMDKFLVNSLSWLTGVDAASSNLTVVIAHMDESYYFRDETRTRSWLSDKVGNTIAVNEADSCDGTLLDGCLSDADLLIVSQIAADGDDIAQIRQSIESAMNNGVPVMYVHHNGDLKPLGTELFDLFNVNYRGDNYWARPVISGFNPADLYNQLPAKIEQANALFAKFSDQSFNFDLSVCSGRSCPESHDYNTQFKTVVDALKSEIDKWDIRKENLFDQEDRRLEKLWVLLADHWRSDAEFPKDKLSSPQNDFLKSLYADHISHIRRELNSAQNDMGDYSRSDFSHITPRNQTVSMTTRRNYRAAGVYALPGQTLTVRRTDNSDVTTSVQINSIRNASIHHFDENGYVRPVHSGASARIPITNNETVEITSPYGGPIHLYFDKTGFDVSFDFTNVGQHPFWNGPDDNAAFSADLTADNYDWAEFATEYFEITGKISRMSSTMSHEFVSGDAEELAQMINRYHHDIPRYLGGYDGDGISPPDEVTDFAQQNNLSLASWDKVQHFNADKPTCGSGCSGNPYDASWAFSPLGHGDLHEVGHGLETSAHRFSEWSGHASTNWYSYYPKLKFFDHTNRDPSCQSLPYERIFADLQNSRSEHDPLAYMAALDYSGWQNGAVIMIQLMASAEQSGTISDGWLVLPRLHILSREFNDADNNDEDWVAKRADIGFGGMNRDTARNLPREDKLAIMASHAIGMNTVEYFEMWGVNLSQTTRDHLANLGHPKMPVTFYAMNEKDHCYQKLGQATPINIDGSSAWPLSSSSKSSAHKTSVLIDTNPEYSESFSDMLGDEICRSESHFHP